MIIPILPILSIRSLSATALTLLLATPCIHAQTDSGMTSLEQYRRPQERVNLCLPEIPGFKTLKCDFHMHTVFSDGQVWPGVRVQEAWYEGLDAICITDHIEYQPHSKDVPTQHDRPYALAKDPAAEVGLLLIKGSEITRLTPPGHFNALFLDDSSALLADQKSELDGEALKRAAAQKAFVFWNHPGWKADKIDGSYEWIPFVDELHKAGDLHGIEVFNGFGFHRKALDWCVDKSLAVLATTDIHTLTAHEYNFQDGRTRTMTLVFAKDRSVEAIREALESARTVAWSSEHLAGPEKLVRGLFEGAVKVGPVHHESAKGIGFVEVTNHSDLTFTLTKTTGPGGLPATISLNPRRSILLKGADIGKLLAETRWSVANAYIRSDRKLEVSLTPGS
jgi:predicted metal-dependent phosphoesterase TrpH